MRDSLRPANLLEGLLVERIVVATWRLKRLARAEQLLYLLNAEEKREELSDEMREQLGLSPRARVMVMEVLESFVRTGYVAAYRSKPDDRQIESGVRKAAKA